MSKPRKGENWTDHRLRTDFGMTTEDWDVLFESQGNGCAICGSKKPGRKDNHWCLDHNHENGKPRGILCHNCNMGIGNFKDNRGLIKEAIKYLARNSK
jgi:Recombination endonuclease VII